MANEDTFRTAEVRNGSVEPLMTTTNELEPALFRALKAPSNAGLGGQIRQNLELAAKLLEFIPIKASVAMASTARESYATHSRFP
jgi:hypothetical protein